MESKEFGEYLRSLRKRKNLTINELAALSEVSNAYISQLETGKKSKPNPHILLELSEHLDVSHEHLMRKASYTENNSEHHSFHDLMTILQEQNDDVYYKGIKLSSQQCKILCEILEEFIKIPSDK